MSGADFTVSAVANVRDGAARVALQSLGLSARSLSKTLADHQGVFDGVTVELDGEDLVVRVSGGYEGDADVELDCRQIRGDDEIAVRAIRAREREEAPPPEVAADDALDDVQGFASWLDHAVRAHEARGGDVDPRPSHTRPW